MIKKSDCLKFAVETAIDAGDNILMKNYGKIQELEWTAKHNFRTEVDKGSDRLIRGRIKKNFPDHNIYSEEDKNLEKNSEFSWIADPLDGTIPYTFGTTDHFGVCIALAKNNGPILGVIYAPKRKELYYAEKGLAAFCNDKQIKVSEQKDLNKTLMGFDPGKETENFKRASFSKYFEKIYSKDGILCQVCSGCASVQMALTASGKLNAYAALSLEPWDMAAGYIINKEAGAKITDINGEKWDITKPSILASNPELHGKLLGLLKK